MILTPEDSFSGSHALHPATMGEDLTLFLALLRGEFNISGLTCRRLRQILKHKTGPQVSRLLRRLRMHGLIRKVGRTYKYYLTNLGLRVILAALHLRQALLIPTLAGPLPANT